MSAESICNQNLYRLVIKGLSVYDDSLFLIQVKNQTT